MLLYTRKLQLLGNKVPQTLTRALPLDPTWRLPSPEPLTSRLSTWNPEYASAFIHGTVIIIFFCCSAAVYRRHHGDVQQAAQSGAGISGHPADADQAVVRRRDAGSRWDMSDCCPRRWSDDVRGAWGSSSTQPVSSSTRASTLVSSQHHWQLRAFHKRSKRQITAHCYSSRQRGQYPVYRLPTG